MGGVITGTAFTKRFPTIDTTSGNGNANLKGFVVAVYNIGCWLGSLTTMFNGESLGRKRSVIVGAAILAIGSVIQFTSFGIPQLTYKRCKKVDVIRRLDSAKLETSSHCLNLLTRPSKFYRQLGRRSSRPNQWLN